MLKNCNNIVDWSIDIKNNALNIKYAINGTWKTTIAKAIDFSVKDWQNWSNLLKQLKPYDSDENTMPEVTWLNWYSKVKIFNEHYINQFAFVDSWELMQWSFEIFIKDQAYEHRMEAIDTLLEDLVNTFNQDENLNWLIDELSKFISKVRLRNDWTMHAWSQFLKALESWNLVENIPTELESYREFIENDDKIRRLGWVMKGKDFIDAHDNCPCCANWIDTDCKIKYNKLSETYDKKSVEHLNDILDNFDSLSHYLNDDALRNIDQVIRKASWLTWDEQEYIVKVFKEVEHLLSKFQKIRNINYYSLKKVTDLRSEIEWLKVNFDLMSYFNNQTIQDKALPINEKLELIVDQIGHLLWKIEHHKSMILATIQKYEWEINDFLNSWGYKYEIDHVEHNESYTLILKPQDSEWPLENPKDKLSFGERNAFALVLFMYDAISDWSDLIVLDDPISSFDENKKFAIISRLFWDWHNNSLRWKTVLMLTHDFAPLIDIVKNRLPASLQGNFQAHFLTNDNWNLSEQPILHSDIHSCIKICWDNIARCSNDINKLIYLRRLFEIQENKNEWYQLLSSLFKKRTVPTKLVYNSNSNQMDEDNMTPQDIAIAEQSIDPYIPWFTYTTYLQLATNDVQMRALFDDTELSNYERLQIYRIIKWQDNHPDKIIRKFINESYHIENDDLFQLNPCQFETIPNYIIDLCTSDLSS